MNDGRKIRFDGADEEGRKLARTVERWKPFPVDVLPGPVGEYVAVASEAIGCDPAYVALPLLSGLASAIGNTRRVELEPGWSAPAVLWTCIVGESGSKKSPAMDAALRPLVGDFDETRPRWYRGGSSDNLAELLCLNPRRLLLVRHDLSGWPGDSESQADGTEAGEVEVTAKWLRMFDADEISVDRVQVPRAAVSIAGGIHPNALERSLARDLDAALAERFLFAYPPRRKSEWTEVSISPELEKELARLYCRLESLESGKDSHSCPAPRLLRLSPGGKEAWDEFREEQGEAEVEASGGLSRAWSRLVGYAPRLALVVHMARWAIGGLEPGGDASVDRESIEAGAALSRWFGHEVARVSAMLGE